MILRELIIALLLGLIGGVIPGPVITAIFTEVLQSGFTRSLRITFLALLVESLVAVISLLILSLAGLREGFFHALSLAGAAILVWIAVSIWKVRSLDDEGFFPGFFLFCRRYDLRKHSILHRINRDDAGF